MSTTPLSNIEERVERSLYESVRQELVDKGYLPDIANDTLYPKTADGSLTPAAQNLFRANQEAIAFNMGFSIEVFNHSSGQQKGLKQVPRIVIVPQDFVPGTLGGDSTRYHVRNGNEYNVFIRPPQTSEFSFNAHLVGNTAKQMRIMKAIIQLALPRRGYVKVYDEPEDVFLVLQTDFANIPQNDEGVLEKIYHYNIPDIYETVEVDTGESIAPITQIDVNMFLGDEDDNTPVDGIEIP